MTDSIRLNAATDAARRSRGPAAASAPAGNPVDKPVRLLGWLCGIGIGTALLIMIGASAVRQDWMTPQVPVPSPGPPWELHVHLSGAVISVFLWLSALLAFGGLVAGLVAARRGARGPIRLILIGAAIAAVLLTVLPPAGSTDPLDYAAYGRLELLGHNPYVATPLYLRVTDPSFGQSVPVHWQNQVSLYGPAATIEQYLAARLGGNSMARVVFWLKLWNTLAFGVVAFVLDRLLRMRPSARLRAHLLWTINPLLLWDLLASGHMDVVAAGAGVIGLLALGRQQPGTEPKIWRALVAGALVGFAADVKIDYALFGLALIWALRRSLPALLAAAGGALAVLAPTYAWLGKPAFAALFARGDKTTQDSFYRVASLTDSKYLLEFAALCFIILAALLLWRMPPGDRLRPALRPALALAVAWVFIWPYTLPWYDAMIVVVLVLYPATWLDWLVLARLTGATIANMPGNPNGVPGKNHALRAFDVFLVHYMTPLVLLGAVGVLLIMIAANVWGLRPEVNRALPGRGRASPRTARALTVHVLGAGTRSGRRYDHLVALEIRRLSLGHLRGVDGNEWPVHGFVVTFPGGAVLVDTGMGGPQQWLDDWRAVNRSVADALDRLGLTPGDIGLVINTHLHFDHCGQNAVFKHAAFYLQRAELDRARRETPQLVHWFDFMNARFELLDGDAEVLPGLRVVATPGHTVGHQSVLVDSADGMSDVLIGDAAYKPRLYLDPQTDDLPKGQADDVASWRESVTRIRATAPDRVHFCHDTEIIHS